MKLEYLMIIEKGGIPIYSHCFGGFCSTLGMDDTLLSGFLSALTSMPTLFGQKESVQSVEMDYTKLMFSQSHPSGKIMVVGVDKNTYEGDEADETIKILFKKINDLLEIGIYSEVNWSVIDNDMFNNFAHELVDGIISQVLNYTPEYCRAGDDCMIAIKTSHDEKAEIEKTDNLRTRFEKRYRTVMGGMPRMMKIMFKPVLKLRNWRGKKKFEKATEVDENK